MATWPPPPPSPPSAEPPPPSRASRHQRQRRRTPGWLAVVAGLIGLSAMVQVVFRSGLAPSTNRVVPTTTATAHHQAAKPNVSMKWVTATDRTCRIAVPRTWSRMELNDDADVELGNSGLHQYLIVVTDNKADLATNLDRFARTGVGSLTRGLHDQQVSAPRHLRVSGRPALQYEIHGIVDSSRIVYWHTSVEGVAHYYQVIAWTGASDAAESGPTLRSVVTTLREITG
jgi:hypothetical protein